MVVCRLVLDLERRRRIGEGEWEKAQIAGDRFSDEFECHLNETEAGHLYERKTGRGAISIAAVEPVTPTAAMYRSESKGSLRALSHSIWAFLSFPWKCRANHNS